MKRFFIVVLVIFCINNSFSQTNLDFETWGPSAFSANDPTGWGTFNLDAVFGPVSTFEETTSPGQGTSSARMVTTTGYAPFTGPGLDTLGGIVSIGGSLFAGATGVAYTGRPTSVDFLFKSNIAVGDTGIFFVQLTHWDGFNTIIDGQGVVFFTSPTVTNWTTLNLPITYITIDTPDTLQIVGLSSRSIYMGTPLPIPGSELQLDSIVINLTSDVGVIAIDAPTSGCGLSATESVTIRVKNFGSFSESTIPVAYSINGGPTIIDTIFTTIISGDTLSYTFTATADLSAIGSYIFDAWTALPGDVDNSNDSTLGYIVINPALIDVFPSTEDFEAEALCGNTLFACIPDGTCGLTGNWINTSGDDIDWSVNEGGTGSGGTGPAADHTTGTPGGNYLFTEASSCNGQTAILTSSCFDISGLGNPIFTYWYHMNGVNMGNLYIEIDSNGTWVTADSIIGAQQTLDTDPWLTDTVNLLGYPGTIRIRMHGVTGPGFESDIAIDDLMVTEIVADDVGVLAVDSPASGCGLTGIENVTIRVVNFGTASQSSIPVSYEINGGGPVNEVIAATILPGDTLSYTFTATVDLSMFGDYTINAWTELGGDGLPGNDSLIGYVVTHRPACCIPTFTNLCSSDDYIDGVSFVGISNSATGCNGNPDNYIYYANDTGIVSTGNSFPITLTPSTLWNQGFGVWIDFNQDGDFNDINEFVFSSAPATTPQVGSISIPGVASLGNTIMRVRCIFGATLVAVNNCDNQTFGETEDYNIIISASATNDVGLISISTPTSHCVDGSTDTITIQVVNYGSVAETSVPVSYTVNGGPAVNETITTTINPGDTVTYTFTTGAVLSPAGPYTIDSWTALPGDVNATNDSSSISITIFPLSAVNLGNDTAICPGDLVTLNTSNFGFVSYSWNTGATDSSITTVIAGTFILTVTDGNTCSNSDTIIVSINPAMTLTMSSTTATCGGSDGTATVAVSGGTGPLTYVWDDPSVQTNSTAASLAGGTYSVTVTDGLTCTDNNSVAVNNTSSPTVSITSSTNVTCSGGNDGQATVFATGGTTPYTYSWDDPGNQTNAIATGLSAGTYIGTVTDNAGCASSDTVTITEPSALSLTPGSVNSNCGASDGSASVAVTGGTGAYTYSWDDPGTQTTDTAFSILAGTYNVTVTDANACTETTSTTVSDVSGGTASIASSTNASCNGVCDGAATASIVGGTAPFTYLWDDPAAQTNITATALCAIAVNVTITDNVGCTSVAGVTLTEPSAFVLAMTSADATCGNPDGSATVTASGGSTPYTYSWDDPFAQTNSTATSLAAGTYSVTVTDSLACTGSNSVAVNNTGAPTVTITSSTNVTCNGGNDGQATVTATGGTTPYTYSWNDPGSQTNATATGLAAGTYIGSVTDNAGCMSSDNVTITEPLALSLTPSSVNSNCGASDGSAFVAVTGGTGSYTYIWDDPGTQTTSTAGALAAGTYNVTVADGNSCVDTASATVSDIGGGTAGIAASTNASCNGVCDGSATASISGGTAPFTYSWDDPAGQTNITAAGLCATAVNVTITDNLGCVSIAGVALTEPTAITLTTASVDATCGNPDGSATVTASGGSTPYTYLWDDPGTQTTDTATGLAAGAYVIIVTDVAGCLGSSTVSVNNAGAPTVTLASSTNVSCNGGNDGQATVSATGGTTPYTYSWDDPGTQSNATATGLGAGTYVGTVTDNAGCLATASVTITEPAAFSISISSIDPSCFGSCNGSATATSTGGTGTHTYSWDDPGTQTTAMATGLCDGTYNVIVTDSGNCTSTAPITITQPVGMALTLSGTDATCGGCTDGTATVSVSGGTSPYTYLWDDPSVQTNATATGLGAGMYNVVVTDASGCVSNDSYTVSDPSIVFTVTIVSANASCVDFCDGFADAVVTGGSAPYTYLWDDPDMQTSATATGLCKGTYNVTVSDFTGTSVTNTFTIFQPSPIIITPAILDATCGNSDGSVSLTTTGGTPAYAYLWSTGGTGLTETGLAAGTYNVTVTDNQACVGYAVFSVGNSDGPMIALSSSDVTCNGFNDGTATASVTSGTAPYTYVWDDPLNQAVATAVGLAPGYYSVTVLDASGCTNISGTTTITEPVAMAMTLSSVDANFGVCNGSVTASVIGGNMPYNYLWNDQGTQTTQSATGLCPGTYTVSVTDAGGCTLADSLFVGPVTGIDEQEANTGMTVFPNPATDVINVKYTGFSDSWSYELYDYTGKLIEVKTGLVENQVMITSVKLTNGIYFIKAMDSKGYVSTRKLIIEK